MKHRILFAVVMGAITTSIISFALIAMNIGFNDKFLSIWMRSWPVSYVLAVSAMLTIAPRIQRLVNHILQKN